LQRTKAHWLLPIISGDNAGSVTGTVGLPASGANGSSISWVTSNSARITTEGVVTRPAVSSGDIVVTLTATIAKGTSSDVKVFSLTVKASGTITPGGTLTDACGNVYHTVRIGTQVWTVENLRTTKYNDGTAITKITSNTTWDSCYYTFIPAYCYYNNTANADSISKFGALYNWYVVHTGKLAPAGWHVPTDSEWEVMQSYLVMHGYNYDGTTDTTNNEIAIALAAKTDWYSDTITGTIGKNLTNNNSSGFSAIPGGYRNYNGYFYLIGNSGSWWSATEFYAASAYYRNLFYVNYNLFTYLNNKGCGFSVRLVRD